MVENCVDCGNPINSRIAEFNRKRYGRPICNSCSEKQKTQRKIEQNNQQNGDEDVVSFQTLLERAHKEGLEEIITEELPSELIELEREMNGKTETRKTEMYKFKAMVVLNKDNIMKKFCAHGDAHMGNVNPNIAPHAYRMAETRAISRALRFALATGVAAEELDNLPDRSKPEIKETVVKR